IVMKYFAKSSLGVLAALSLLPATAQAGTYSPSPSGGTTPTVVEVKKGLTLLCTLTATTRSNGSISTTLPTGTGRPPPHIPPTPNPHRAILPITRTPSQHS